MEIEIGKLLIEKNYTISCAESCTGGRLTDRLTNVSGSSAYVKGTIVAYSNEVKINILHVKEETINNLGAVSEETAREMAENVRKVLNTDIGVSITGIAGPTGGTPEKPVGTVFIGISGPNGDKVEQFKFNGSRIEVKEKVVEAALVLIQVYLTIGKNS
jgi:PncC family amidohydrolase